MDSEENIDTMQRLNSFKECIDRYFGEKEFPITELTDQDCGDEWVLGSSYKDQQLEGLIAHAPTFLVLRRLRHEYFRWEANPESIVMWNTV